MKDEEDVKKMREKLYANEVNLLYQNMNLNSSDFIDVTGLSSGIYFVKLIDNKNILAIKKLLVK